MEYRTAVKKNELVLQIWTWINRRNIIWNGNMYSLIPLCKMETINMIVASLLQTWKGLNVRTGSGKGARRTQGPAWPGGIETQRQRLVPWRNEGPSHQVFPVWKDKQESRYLYELCSNSLKDWSGVVVSVLQGGRIWSVCPPLLTFALTTGSRVWVWTEALGRTGWLGHAGSGPDFASEQLHPSDWGPHGARLSTTQVPRPGSSEPRDPWLRPWASLLLLSTPFPSCDPEPWEARPQVARGDPQKANILPVLKETTVQWGRQIM